MVGTCACPLSTRVYVDLKRYAEALTYPDPDKIRHYIEETCFYLSEDTAIVLAIRFRLNITPSEPVVYKKVDPSASRGRSGKPVCRGWRYLDAANAFFETRIDRVELEQRLDIGLPECEAG